MNFLEEPQSKNLSRSKNVSSHWRDLVFILSIAAMILLVIVRYGKMEWSFEFPTYALEAINVSSLSVNNDQNLEEDEGVIGGDVPIAYLPPDPVLKEDAEPAILPELLSARSVIVKDKESGKVLYSKDEYLKHPAASITKLLCGITLLDYDIDWSTTTQASQDKVFDTVVMPAKQYLFEDLWSAAFIGSSNLAVLTIAETVVGDRAAFVERMNKKALEIGMSDSSFVEPTGLDDNNISTASDIAILLSESLEKERIRHYLLEKEFDIMTVDKKYKRHIWNTDWLLLGWIPHKFIEFYGGKTGFIPASNYNFAMEVGDGEGHTIQVVILGAENNEARFIEARDLAKWAFASYEWPTIN